VRYFTLDSLYLQRSALIVFLVESACKLDWERLRSHVWLETRFADPGPATAFRQPPPPSPGNFLCVACDLSPADKKHVL
jgi:hypothetical protein